MDTKTVHRRTYLDILRILASFLVCYNHASSFHIFLDQEANGSLLSWIMVFSSVFCRINLPLFIMISGALLLGRERTYRELLQRVLRFMILLAGASLIKFIHDHPADFSWTGYARNLLSGNINMSYWYLYAYMGLLLVQPFLHRIAVALTWKDILCLTALRFLMITFFPAVNYVLQYLGMDPIGISVEFRVPLSTVHVLYYSLTGYYLANNLPLDNIRRQQVWFCGGILFISVLLPTLVTYHEGVHFAFSQTYLTLLDYIAAIAVFILVRRGFQHVVFSKKVQRILSHLSSCTLGIYLMEPLIAQVLYTKYFCEAYYQHHHLIQAALSCLWCLFIMGSGCVLTTVLRKVPGCKKLL